MLELCFETSMSQLNAIRTCVDSIKLTSAYHHERTIENNISTSTGGRMRAQKRCSNMAVWYAGIWDGRATTHQGKPLLQRKERLKAGCVEKDTVYVVNLGRRTGLFLQLKQKILRIIARF